MSHYVHEELNKGIRVELPNKIAQIPQSNDLITSHMNDVENKASEFREKEMTSQTGKSGSSQREEVI